MSETIGGLKSIVEKIESDARAASKAILKEADDKARAILDDAAAEADKIKTASEERAKNYYEELLELNESTVKHKSSQAMLSEKQKLLGKTIDAACGALKSLDDGEYFKLISSMLKRYAENQDGELLFSENDIERMPDDLKKYLKSDYSGLTVKSSPSVDYGFIVKYGDIEENCTFDALIESNSDSIKTAVYEELFGKA